MRHAILIVFAIFLACAAANAQERPTQEDIDAGARAFREVRALRALTEAQKVEKSANLAVIAAKDEVIAAKNETIRVKDLQIKERDETIESLLKRVEALSKLKCDKTSLLFGLIKKTSCH